MKKCAKQGDLKWFIFQDGNEKSKLMPKSKVNPAKNSNKILYPFNDKLIINNGTHHIIKTLL